MKILLSIPPARFRINRFLTSGINSPHLGLAYLAALLIKEGFEVQIIDAQQHRLNFIRFNEIVARINPDLIGITAFTQCVEEAGLAAKELKKLNPKIPIVIGGCHPTALPEQTLAEFPDFDVAVFGEGEDTCLELAKTIENGGTFKEIKGLAYRSDEKIRINPSRALIPNLDKLPFPGFELFPLAKYPNSFQIFKNKFEVPLKTARGCPYSCNFCFRVMGSQVRFRSIDMVIEEIKYRLRTLPAKKFIIMDENFTISRKRTLEFCDRIQKNGIQSQVSFVCGTRVDLVDLELLQEMKKAGVDLIFFGAESGVIRILERSGKAIIPEQIEAALRWAQEAGIRTQLSYIIGHPDETKKEIKKSLETALRLNPDFIFWARMVPYPGTELFEQMKKENPDLSRIPWSDYQTQFKSGFGNLYLNPNSLERLQIYGYLRFYLRYNRILNLFRVTSFKIAFRFFLYYFKNFFIR